MANCSKRLFCLFVLATIHCTFALSDSLRACESKSCICRERIDVACYRQGAWFIANTGSFQVCSLASAEEAERVARHSEKLRAEMIDAWHATDASHPMTWTPRCQIILHSTTRSYLCAVGKQLASTRGSSLVTPTRGTIISRRIDLRRDVDDLLTAALPHELCHVVLADLFRNEPPPLWFEEGVALLADPSAKQQLHQRDLRLAMKQSRVFRLQSFIVMREYPAADCWDVFYGQSASLVGLLMQQGSPAQLLQFAKNVEVLGPDAAVREVYGFSNCGALEETWRCAVSSPDEP